MRRGTSLEIELPDGTVLDAPDDADPSAVAKAYLAKQSQPTPPKLGPLVSAAVRPIAKAAMGVPGIFADGTMAAWNLASGQRNQMPSAAANNLLDKYTTAPTGIGKGAEFVSTSLLGSAIPMPPVGRQTPAVVTDLSQIARTPPDNFMQARDALRNSALQNGQKEGYVVPPSSNNPTLKNRLLEGISGKVKLNQEAVIRNQPVTDRLAAQGVGESAEAAITPSSLDVIRGEAFKAGYEPIRSIGKVTTDASYLSTLDDVTKAAKGAERSFPGITPKNNPIKDVVDSLKQREFDAADGVDAIRVLRDNADEAYAAGNSALGKQFKSAAKAVEDMIERELVSRGDDGAATLKAFREARTLIAKTHTAQKAMVGETGASNAQRYAAELIRGSPLSGDQRKIAKFAAQFGKYTPKPNGENFTPFGPLDVYGSGALSVGMDSALPFAYPLSRIGLREYLLSPAGQKMALRATSGPRRNLGLLGGAFPQAEQGLNDLLAQ